MGNGEGRMQMESPSRMVTINSNVLPVLPALECLVGSETKTPHGNTKTISHRVTFMLEI